MTFDRETLDKLFRYCLALTGEREEARDLLHTALENFLRHRPVDLQYPLAYIRRIARNHFYDQLRRRSLAPFEPLPDADIHPAIEQELESLMVNEITVQQLWQQLNPGEREVIFLWSVEGLSASEIALQLAEPRGTVLSRLHRLKLRLRNQYPELIGGGGHD